MRFSGMRSATSPVLSGRSATVTSICRPPRSTDLRVTGVERQFDWVRRIRTGETRTRTTTTTFPTNATHQLVREHRDLSSTRAVPSTKPPSGIFERFASVEGFASRSLSLFAGHKAVTPTMCDRSNSSGRYASDQTNARGETKNETKNLKDAMPLMGHGVLPLPGDRWWFPAGQPGWWQVWMRPSGTRPWRP